MVEKPPVENPYSDPRYRAYVLGLLMVVYAFNFIDRQLLVILQEPIKADLGLSDTQLGLLSGFAFAIFYVSCGIPIARWADNSNRKRIIAISITIWSAMTAISGLAQNFVQLLLARIGVGVGEAGASPPAHSMLSDIYPPEKRATVLSIYSVGLYIGILTGFILGGWISEYFGWRTAFMVVGLPGILIAGIVAFTIREPVRGWSEQHKQSIVQQASPPFMDVLRLLWSRRSFRHLAFAAGLHSFVTYGTGNWSPSYFLRTFDISLGELSTWMGLASGLGGALGTYVGGVLSDRLGANDKRWYMWLPALAASIALPIALYIYTSHDLQLILWLNFLPTILMAFYLGPVLGTTHNLVGLRMRALSSAIIFFFINLIGLGLGPTTIGIVSDILSSTEVGDDSLRYALIGVATIGTIWCVFHYLMASRYIREDLANAPE